MIIAGATCAPPPKTNDPPGAHPSGPGGVGVAGAPGTMDSNPLAEAMMQLDAKNNDDDDDNEPGRISGIASNPYHGG